MASWECGFGGNWVDFPDLSNCSRIDTNQAIEELNQPSSVPSDVLGKLYQNVTNESNLGSGDIKNLINVLEEALKVQNDRLDNAQADNPTDYADSFTKKSLEMVSEILERPQTWFGLPQDTKNDEITKVQNNLDQVAKSLLKNTDQNEHSYNSGGVVLKVLKNFESQADFVNSNGDQISVKAEGQLESSISFLGFTSLACIIDNRFEW